MRLPFPSRKKTKGSEEECIAFKGCAVQSPKETGENAFRQVKEKVFSTSGRISRRTLSEKTLRTSALPRMCRAGDVMFLAYL